MILRPGGIMANREIGAILGGRPAAPDSVKGETER